MRYFCLDPQSQEALRATDGGWLLAEAALLPRASGTPNDLPDQYAIPANAVVNAPPSPRHNKEVPVASSIVYDDQGYPVARWTFAPDYRGEVWFRASGQGVLIAQLGDPSTQGLLTTPPPQPRARRAKKAATKAATPKAGWLGEMFRRGRPSP